MRNLIHLANYQRSIFYYKSHYKSAIHNPYSLFPTTKKRHHLSLCTLLLLLFATACNQPHTTQTGEESELIERIGAAGALREIAPDSTHVLLDAIWAKNASRMTDSEKVSFYNMRGSVYSVTYAYEAAKANFQQALYYFEKLNNGNLARKAQILLNIGNTSGRMGKAEDALAFYRQARVLLNYPDDTELILSLYMNKSAVFSITGETDSLFYYAQLLSDIATGEECRELEAQILTNTAIAFFNLGRLSQAEENLRRAIVIFAEFNNQSALRITYRNLATALISQDRIEEGLFYAQKADEIAVIMGLPPTARFVYYNEQGHIYLKKRDYHNSLTMFYQALALSDEKSEMRVSAGIKSTIGLTYTRLGDFDTAYSYLSAARRVAQENALFRLETGVQRNLSILYAMRGDIDNFMIAMETESKLRDKLFSEENTRALYAIQTQYERKIDQLLITNKAEEIRRQRVNNSLLVLAFSVFIIASVLYTLFQRKKMRDVQRAVQQYETILKLKKEMQQSVEQKIDTSASLSDQKKGLIVSEMSEKLMPEIERLFNEEKIYKRQGLIWTMSQKC